MPSSITRKIHWLPVGRWTQGAIPPDWRRCLLDRGSLTQRLIDASSESFAVRVVREAFLVPRLDERQLLDLPTRRRSFVREVLLYVDGSPRVFARSVIPLSTLTGRLRKLRRLDDRPLGAVLFADPGMARGPLEIARVPAAMIPGDHATDDTSYWGRRSLFYMDSRPLLVSEIFLTDHKP